MLHDVLAMAFVMLVLAVTSLLSSPSDRRLELELVLLPTPYSLASRSLAITSSMTAPLRPTLAYSLDTPAPYVLEMPPPRVLDTIACSRHRPMLPSRA